MEKIQVGYSRKESTDDYGSVGISGMVEFEPKSDDLQKEFDEMFLYLKMTVEAKLEGLNVKKDQTQAIAQTGHIPPHPDTSTVTEQVRSGDVSETVQQPESTVQASPEENAAKPKPSTGITKEEIFLGKAKVFRRDLKRDRNNKSFAELRIGHEDLGAHQASLDMADKDKQYITVKTWEPDAVAAVGSIEPVTKEGGQVVDMKTFFIEKDDLIDVWGRFNPWRSDPGKYDLNATALKKSE